MKASETDSLGVQSKCVIVIHIFPTVEKGVNKIDWGHLLGFIPLFSNKNYSSRKKSLKYVIY